MRQITPGQRPLLGSCGAFLIALIMIGMCGSVSAPARADVTTDVKDTLRTGWYPDQGNLTPELVSGSTFGQLFSTAIDGQVFAQPLVSQGTLFVATATNNIYGLNSATGAIKWSRNLGTPFNAAADLSCGDISPSVGIIGTPVIDSATNTAYFTKKTYVSGSSGAAAYYMHAVDVATGAEKSGFPVLLQGSAANDSTHTFDPIHQLQRPGLLLLNGVIYAAFGGHCDRKPFEGWIIGVSTAGKITTLWTDEAGQAQSASPGGGIWAPGWGLVSDSPNSLILSSGNGNVGAPPIASNQPPGALGQAVARLTVQSDGSLTATDFFSPYDAATLNTTDSDVGAGGPIELPAQYFGTASHPNLVIEVGKQGYIYILDANHLGGMGQGPNGGDAVINRVGPYGGVWGRPAVWPGDGGYVYATTAQSGGGTGKLKAFKYSLDGAGNPTLSLVGTSSDLFGFSSSSPIVTSSGVTSGSALVWTIWTADVTGAGAQIRAYDPVPVNGVLTLRYSAPIGTANKFTPPAVDNNRVYVGTRDGHILCFGSPVVTPLSGSALDFPTTVVGQSATATMTLTANNATTVTGLSSTNTVFSVGTPTPALPASLTSGQTIAIPITFKPTATGLVAADLNVTTSTGNASFGVGGNGQSANPQISADPAVVSFGGVVAGGQPVSSSVIFSNVGAAPFTITSITQPNAPFSVSGLPAVGASVASNGSFSVTASFAPTAVGQFTDTLTIATDAGGTATVTLSGSGGAPPKISITPLTLNYGNVSVGATAKATFKISNTGGSALTITKSKPPASGVGFVATSTLAEGSVIQAGGVVTETVTFAPNALGAATDTWTINSDDATAGVQTVTFNGTGTAPLPALYITDTTTVQPTSGTTTANFTVTLDQASASTVTVKYATKDGSASSKNGDFVAIPSTTLTFNPGETSKTIPVTINGSTLHHGTNTFTVNLSSPTNATLGDASGKGWLASPIGPFSVFVGDAAVTASSSGAATANVPVSLSATPQTGETVTVVVNTANGTAIAGTDYVAIANQTLTFTNATGATITVPVTVNTAATGAGNKTFTLTASTPSSNATLGDAQGLVTIVNGGSTPAPSIYVSDGTVVRPASGTTTISFTVTLSQASTSQVTVAYATHDSSATVANGDYVAKSGTLTFTPGVTSQTVSVTVNPITYADSDKYFYLNLTGATNAVIGDKAGQGNLVNPNGRIFIYVGNVVVYSGTSATTAQAQITLSTPVPSGKSVTVKVATADGSATIVNGDYTQVPLTTLTFVAGQQTATVTLTINAQPAGQPLKNFFLNLSSSSTNAIIADTPATITIVGHS